MQSKTFECFNQGHGRFSKMRPFKGVWGIGGRQECTWEDWWETHIIYGRNSGLAWGCESRCGNQMIDLTPNSSEMEFTGLHIKISGASEIQEWIWIREFKLKVRIRERELEFSW